MTLSSQTPQRRTDVYDARRARHHGLRAVASALGLRDFVESRRPRCRKREGARGPGLRLEAREGTQRPGCSRRTSFGSLSSLKPTKTVWRRSPSSDQLR